MVRESVSLCWAWSKRPSFGAKRFASCADIWQGVRVERADTQHKTTSLYSDNRVDMGVFVVLTDAQDTQANEDRRGERL